MLNNNETIILMKRFVEQSQSYVCSDDAKQFLLESSVSIVSRMIKDAKLWEGLCTFNIENVGSQLLQRIRDFDFSDEEIEHIFVICYRFACEFDFSGGNSYEIDSLLRDIDNRSVSLSGRLNGQITYARYTMPVAITKRVLNDPAIELFRNFPEISERAKDQQKKLETVLTTKIEEVEKLKNTLENYKDAFNFVGLHQGFGNILDKKQTEKKYLRGFLILFGVLLIVPIICTLLVRLNMQDFNLWHGVSLFLPVMSLELILIYFFRILLSNYNSLKTQIVQLELRQTLCQFIQGYSEYAIEIKKADKQVLDKFENIIFSSVLSDESNIPSTFDGLDAISKLMKSIKNT